MTFIPSETAGLDSHWHSKLHSQVNTFIGHHCLSFSVLYCRLNSNWWYSVTLNIWIQCGPHYPSLTHINCLAVTGRQLENVSYDTWCYMPSHEDDAKGGFTLGSGFKKLGVQNKPRWTLLWDSSLEISFSNQEEYFLELGPPRFGGKVMPY